MKIARGDVEAHLVGGAAGGGIGGKPAEGAVEAPDPFGEDMDHLALALDRARDRHDRRLQHGAAEAIEGLRPEAGRR